MADLKISELTNLTAADPANDMIPIVDVSATPPASGSTKRISINNILACSPSATLASATITGDLTVDTSTLKVDSANNRVGVGTASPSYPFDATGGFNSLIGRFLRVGSYGEIIRIGRSGVSETASIAYPSDATFAINTSSAERFSIDGSGVCAWSNVGGVAGTAMTLNSTGLGVGVSPDFKFVVNGTQSTCSTSGSSTTDGSLRIGAPGTGLVIDTGVTAASAVYGWIQARARTDYSSNFNLVLQPNGGNVGVGVTPITSHILSAAGPVGISGTNAGTRTSYISNANACSIYYTDGGGAGYFTDFGNLIIQPRTSAARSVVIATGSTTPVERAVVKSTGQVRFVPLAADPSGAESGDVYYNSTSNKLKCYNGTSWNDLF